MFFSEIMSASAPKIMSALAEARHNDLLKEAEIHRSLKRARGVRLRLQDRLLMSVGSFLISTGKKLQGRYAAVVPHSSGIYRSGC